MEVQNAYNSSISLKFSGDSIYKFKPCKFIKSSKKNMVGKKMPQVLNYPLNVCVDHPNGGDVFRMTVGLKKNNPPVVLKSLNLSMHE